MVENTRPQSATWNADLLKLHVDERFASIERNILAALAAAEKAVEKALASAEKATTKAEADIERWRQANNEWRAAMLDRETKFVSLSTYDARHKALEDRLVDLERTLSVRVSSLEQARDLAAGHSAEITSHDTRLSVVETWQTKSATKAAAYGLSLVILFIIITTVLRFLPTGG